ncbi:hypothetical protein, partial [Bacteroides hominis]|uniref:hypothetical protein n=1 Tax=Bacteroides hominis TaxID=2763023 RepID=UPI0022A16722|nr:hypothetical protein [Bacteroides fragilis]
FFGLFSLRCNLSVQNCILYEGGLLGSSPSLSLTVTNFLNKRGSSRVFGQQDFVFFVVDGDRVIHQAGF